MDPSKIQVNVPISFFHYPNFGFVTQLPFNKLSSLSLSISITWSILLKLVSAIFHQILFFHRMIALQKQ